MKKTENNPNQVQEYKRTCKVCGKVWHSLVSRENQIQRDMNVANLNQCSNSATCCSSAALQAQRNVGSFKDSLEKLKSCPDCGSQNYKEEILTYEKK